MSQILTSSSGGGGGDDITSINTDSGSATPVAGVINIFGGTNVTTTAAGNTVTINASGSGAIPWTTFSGGPDGVTFAVNNGYINNSGFTFFNGTLPAAMVVGDMIIFQNVLGNNFEIHANTGQEIYDATTHGTLATVYGYGALTLRCLIDNTYWQLESSSGTIDITTP